MNGSDGFQKKWSRAICWGHTLRVKGRALVPLGWSLALNGGPHQPPITWERALRREGVGSSSGEFPPRFSGKQEAGLSGHQLRVEGGVTLEAAEEGRG